MEFIRSNKISLFGWKGLVLFAVFVPAIRLNGTFRTFAVFVIRRLVRLRNCSVSQVMSPGKSGAHYEVESVESARATEWGHRTDADQDRAQHEEDQQQWPYKPQVLVVANLG